MNDAPWPTRLKLIACGETQAARERLTSCGHELETLPSEGGHWQTEVLPAGADAVTEIPAREADAILLDAAPDTLDDLVRRLRASDVLTPILVIVDSAEQATVDALFAAGADEYLPASQVTPLLLERTLRLCTRTQALESRLEYLAQHDLLTGLANRRLFDRQLDLALHTAQRHGRFMALAVLELDDFARRLHEEGQEAAEGLLKQSAQRLRNLLRRSDLVARSHSDEFLLLLECSADINDLALTASRILESLRADSETCPGTCVSMGLAIFPRSGQEPRQLFEQARAALREVREAGGNDFRVYDESLEVVSQRRVLMERALPGAIARGEFDIRYQPRFDLPSRRIVGAEVLLRWHSPDFGAVSPDQFIPVAESSGAISRIGSWVLEQAIEAGRRWMNSGHPLRLAVNVSAGQFRSGDFGSELRASLSRHGLPACMLELELTEGVFVANVAAHRDLFASLNELGVGLSVDDFGTGYSALAYLRHFPVHALKIDRTFIAPLPDSEDDAAIVRAIVALGHALDLRVVAEGVDAQEQLRFLTEIGCDEIQGFLIGKPMTAAELGSLLSSAASQ